MPQQSINALDRRLYSAKNDAISSAVTRSTEQTILVSDIISEGPIEGLVGGGTGIYLENDALQSTEQTAMPPQAGVTASFSTSSTTVTVDPGLSTFKASVGNEGTKFLMVYGVDSTSVTMSSITAPSETWTFEGNPFESGTDAQTKRIPIGGKATLTRTAGSSMAASWAQSTDNNSYVNIDKPANGNRFVTLKLSQSGHNLRGSLSSINTTNQTGVFTWGAQLNWKMLMSDADRANGAVHTLEAGVFLEIASISGNTITLANAPGFTKTGLRFGITAAFLDNDASGAETVRAEEKYVNSGYSFNSGTARQEAMPTLEGVGTSSVALPVSDSALEKGSARIITASGAQASEVDEIKILVNYPNGLYTVSEESGREYPAGAAYKIELSVDQGSGDNYKIVQGNATFNNESVWAHTGQHKSAVQFEMRFSIQHKQPFNGFKVRVTRVTKHDPDDMSTFAGSGGETGATGSNLLNAKARIKGVYQSVISSALGIIKEKLSFPHTAMANVSFSSKSFTNVPTLSYLFQGLKIFLQYY